MSLGNAIGSQGGRDGVGWQVDIPGMITMLTRLGSSGLKRIAESGVAVHTILCMSQIAERCPISNDFRKDLHQSRHKQRKEYRIYYKLVEIGGRTNFISDEMLEKRPGENCIGLLASLVPVMSGDACDDILLSLFEKSGAPPDDIPGLGQLRTIREALTPLARKTYFSGRVNLYYHFISNFLNIPKDQRKRMNESALPDAETATRIILSLYKISQEEPGMILEYYGFWGASWVIAYARDVLGLVVCVLKSPSESVPISGDYQTASVFVHIYKYRAKYQLRRQGEIQESFVPSEIGKRGRGAWLINVDD